MLKFLSSLLIYIVSLGVYGVWTYFIVSSKVYRKSKWVIFGGLLCWIGLIFNITYTGLLGWNFTPASDLESFLDSVTFVISLFGYGTLYYGLKK